MERANLRLSGSLPGFEIITIIVHILYLSSKYYQAKNVSSPIHSYLHTIPFIDCAFPIKRKSLENER